MGQVISFQRAVQKKAVQREHIRKKRDEYGYCCYVTLERLQGYCELLICEEQSDTAECFFLCFSPEGLLRCSSMRSMEIMQWRKERIHKKISYLQAIRLLGDAVRQRYKYQRTTEWIPEKQSIHLQRIWQEEFYNDKSEAIDWLLPKQECGELLHTFFRAVSNKDAVLLYDLSAEQVQHTERRSLFAHHWNHVLEDLRIADYVVDEQSVCCNGENDYTLFLTLRCDDKSTKVLEVDMQLRVVEEVTGFRILHDRVLEPRLIF